MQTHSLDSKLNGWYLDNGTIDDELEALLLDIRRVLDFCESSGMELNTEKCEVFFMNASEEEEEEMYREISGLLPGIRKVDKSTFELLGAPIFEECFQRIFWLRLNA